MQRVVVLAIFALVFVLANCYEIASYDTPQQAMKDESGTEVRDGTNNILIVDDDATAAASDEDGSCDKCSVACLKNNMVITIPKPVLRGADREHIRALDMNCKASENLTHFILNVPLTRCGTKTRHAVSSVVYSNEALPVPAIAKDVVSHVPDFQIPFHCYYDNDGLVSAVGLKPSSRKVIFSKKGFGKFALRLELYPDIRFVGPYTQRDFPVMKKLRERIFFEALVDTIDHRLTILARDCYATPSPKRNSEPKYWIIHDGCKVDETLTYHPSNKRSERFSVQSFKFIGEHAFVYVHCHVRICNVSDPNSKCVRVCDDRRKRDVTLTAESLDDVYPLAQGPLSLQKGDVSRQRKESPVKSTGPIIPINGMLAAVIVLCVAAISYMAWKRRKEIHDYSTLVEEIED